MKNLKINNEKLRDLYLRDLSLGYLQGPPTGKPSIDKKWLKFYSGEQILDSFVPDETIFNYMMKENLNHLDDVALYYFGKKITYRELRRQIFRFASSIASCGIKKGDNVIVSKYAGTEVKYEGEEYLIVKQDDILAIVK